MGAPLLHNHDPTARFLGAPRIRVSPTDWWRREKRVPSAGHGTAASCGLAGEGFSLPVWFRPPRPRAREPWDSLSLSQGGPDFLHCWPGFAHTVLQPWETRFIHTRHLLRALVFCSTINSLLPQPCSRLLFETGSGRLARVGLGLSVLLLPRPPECWDYRYCAVTFLKSALVKWVPPAPPPPQSDDLNEAQGPSSSCDFGTT